MAVSNGTLRKELENLAEQCKHLREKIHHNNSLNHLAELNHSNHSLDDSYDRMFGRMQTPQRYTRPLPTAIDVNSVEWQKLMSDFQAFFRMFTNVIYYLRFQDVLRKVTNNAVSVEIIDELDVLIKNIDNDLKVQSISNSEVDDTFPAERAEGDKRRLLFISHSSDDTYYMGAFIRLLNYLGLHEEDIVCTSVEGYDIPLGENIYNWLIEKLQTFDLHVLFILSHNYYKSAASLNEMGAAWATKQKWDAMLLPGFDFSEVKGCIDKDQIGLKLDASNVKHKLGELRDELVEEFGLRKPSESGWERYRDEFLKTVQDIYDEEQKDDGSVSQQSTITSVPITTPLSEMSLNVDATILLAYASKDPQGQILDIQTLGGGGISTCDWNFVENGSPREIARWKGAIDILLHWGLIRLVGRKDKIYEVTDKGYQMAKAIIADNEIDVTNNPDEYLKEMEV